MHRCSDIVKPSWPKSVNMECHSLNSPLQVVRSDGNCFFRAVGQQLSMHHTELRERTCDYIESHDDVFRPFVEDEDETLEE